MCATKLAEKDLIESVVTWYIKGYFFICNILLPVCCIQFLELTTKLCFERSVLFMFQPLVVHCGTVFLSFAGNRSLLEAKVTDKTKFNDELLIIEKIYSIMKMVLCYTLIEYLSGLICTCGCVHRGIWIMCVCFCDCVCLHSS